MGPLFWLRTGLYVFRGVNYVRQRKFRFIVGGAVTAGTVTVLAKNGWDVNSIGAVRFARAGFTFASIAADYKLNCYLRELPKEEDAVQKLWSDVHKRSAEKLLKMCEGNRGVFIKVGQHLGSMWYLLPPEYTTTLQILHSRAPESPMEDVYAVIREDLKAEPEELFEEFEPKILGAASLAQVYKAKLKTGETVAVKVQHRQVRSHCYVDMKTMELLVKLASKLFPEFKFWWLADATRKNIPMELDFLNEGRNAELVGSTLRELTWLKIPRIYWKYCTERVLTMEFLDGGFVNDLDYLRSNGIAPADVAEKLGTMYSKMIFTHGLVHCDPHPGNVMVMKDSKGKLQIGLLDHGLYANLPTDFRYSYAQLWLAIINQDGAGMEKYAKELGVGEHYRIFPCIVTARSWNQLTDKSLGGVTAIKSQAEASFLKRRMAELLPEITEVFERIPRAMVLVMKTNDLLRGVECALQIHATLASFVSMTKYCVHAVYAEKLRLSESAFTSIKLHFQHKWELFRISLFQFYLKLVTCLHFRRQIESQDGTIMEL